MAVAVSVPRERLKCAWCRHYYNRYNICRLHERFMPPDGICAHYVPRWPKHGVLRERTYIRTTNHFAFVFPKGTKVVADIDERGKFVKLLPANGGYPVVVRRFRLLRGDLSVFIELAPGEEEFVGLLRCDAPQRFFPVCLIV